MEIFLYFTHVYLVAIGCILLYKVGRGNLVSCTAYCGGTVDRREGEWAWLTVADPRIVFFTIVVI